jgi:hypothetical protein
MNVQTFIAVYMDHSSANIMQLVNNAIATEVIESAFDHEEKMKALHKGESTMHQKEHQLQLSYYNTIKDKLRRSKDVLLFGTTTAKAELLNILNNDPHFNEIKIVVTQTDKMTENQQHAFVKNHIKTHLI